MTEKDSESVLIRAPQGRDALLMRQLLELHGVAVTICMDSRQLLDHLAGSACAVLTQEALDAALQRDLSRALAQQPPWSDFPVVLFVNAQNAEQSQRLAVELGNVTILERPVAPHTLLSAVHAALRMRRRQYEARAAIQQRDQFLAMLGHELRNPLGAIVLASQLARANPDRAKLDERLALIDRQSNLLARLVDDLLDVARVTSGKVRLRRESVDIDGAIRGCLAALADRALKRGISIVQVRTSGAIIEGDPVRIEQIISNLVANAIKYSPSGRTVTVSSAVVDDHCEIRIRDQGIGISPDMQKRVFELFAQADGSLERAEGGMGIGLTLVDRLVRLHGGSVELQSEGLGHGSEVIVRLPVGDPQTSNNVLKLAARMAHGKLRIVLVEDNNDLRELTAALLEDLGCDVEVAVDGPGGLDLITRSKPDLALVDIGLPGMDGYAIARELRSRLGPDQLLVAVSGYGLDQDREASHRAGFDLHLTKPLDAKALRGVLDRAHAKRERASG